MRELGIICVALALVLDTASYWKQIAKILKTKTSRDVSSTSYLLKILKGLCACIGLLVYANYVGLGMEIILIIVYSISLYVICKFKPKGWKLWK